MRTSLLSSLANSCREAQMKLFMRSVWVAVASLPVSVFFLLRVIAVPIFAHTNSP
jgi:hypothetical protein